ncbi:MAG: DNA primase small subunit PriS [Candidatus Bathyarchaeia archaeon]
MDSYLKQKFFEYYESNIDRIKPPLHIEKREFGFILFKDRTMVRHRGFRDIEELRNSIKTIVPADAYNSTAYYSNPEESMDKKAWEGADLCFDIDADHLQTSCKNVHDEWKCLSCGKEGRGVSPKNCPDCKQEKIEEKVWFCENCLEKARDEVKKLIEVLEDDFGISNRAFHIYFSGHRGYHVHVRAEEVVKLKDEERKEIVDYLTGSGVDIKLFMLELKNIDFDEVIGHKVSTGWRSRVMNGIYNSILSLEEADLIKMGLDDKIIKEIMDEKNKLENVSLRKISEAYFRLKGKAHIHILDKVIDSLSVKIDTVVTTDIHRLIRLPETLNSKTGFRVIEVNLNDLDGFNPFNDALAFTGKEEKVYIKDSPEFRLKGETYGPFHEEVKILPIEAAMLLICKRRASPITE